MDRADGAQAVLPGNVGLHIRLVQLGIFREFQRIFHGTGLTPSHHAMLAVIRENPGIRPGALAEVLAVCSSNIAAAMAVLDEAGLVSRTIDDHDRRASCLRLTAKGEQVMEEAQRRVDAFERELLAGFTDRERDQLRHYLKRVLDSMA